MNRRSFLKFIPAVGIGGKKVATDVMSELSVGGQLGVGPSAEGYALDAVGSGEAVDARLSKVMGLKKQLARLVDPSWLAEQRSNFKSVGHLDPDIACRQSYSLCAKIAAQRERNFDRWVANERTWLERAIGFEGT